MTLRRSGCHVALAWAVLAVSVLRAEFTPGHVFVAVSPGDFCFSGPSRIYEVDPQTGEVTLFSEIPAHPGPCPYWTGLTFTPDGSRLRAASLLWDSIVEFDSDGTMTTLYAPVDSSCGHNPMTYDAEGNFYVIVSGSSILLRYPAGGGGPTVLADFNDGIRFCTSIAFAADGDLYLTPGGNGAIFDSQDYVLRFPPTTWEASIFDGNWALTTTPHAIATDAAGFVYVGESSRIHRYRAGNPGSRIMLAQLGAVGTITLSPDQRSLHVVETSINPSQCNGGEICVRLLVVDALDGSHMLTTIVAETGGVGAMAAVPVIHAPADLDVDGTVGLPDFARFQECFTGAGGVIPPGCGLSDLDHDLDVDFADFAGLQRGLDIPEGP